MGNSKWLVVFAGGEGEAPIERLLGAARQAISLDLIEHAQKLGFFDSALVCTNDEEFASAARAAGAYAEMSPAPFHFGRALSACVNNWRMGKVFYAGSGTMAMASDDDLVAVINSMESNRYVASNNLYSADLAAFAPAAAIELIDPPDTDNDLAWRLHFSCGLPYTQFPDTIGFNLDVDTPADLALLKLRPGNSPRLSSLLAGAKLKTGHIARLVEMMGEPSKELLVAGRVSLRVWPAFQAGTACSTRLLCEERGMRASGRLQRGEVRSLLGFLAEEKGFKMFFRMLEDICDAAIIDTRVIFAHLKLSPSRPDRYASDNYQVEAIDDMTIREFTAAAAESKIPVVMGGHSLVSGGLSTLLELHKDRLQDVRNTAQADLIGGPRTP